MVVICDHDVVTPFMFSDEKISRHCISFLSFFFFNLQHEMKNMGIKAG